MDRFPDITIKDPEELQEALNDDLEILKGEDLDTNPFVVEPHDPAAVASEAAAVVAPRAEPIKPKKPISEKQRLHLENMREKAKIKKLEKTTKKEDKIIEQAELSPEVIEEMNAKEFDKWMQNMEKFNSIMMKQEEKKRIENEKEKKKEQEIEKKIRAKIAAETVKQEKLMPPRQVLQQQETNTFGEFSNYF